MSGYRDPDPEGTFYGNSSETFDYLRIIGAIPESRAAVMIAAAQRAGKTAYARIVLEYRPRARVNRRYRVTHDFTHDHRGCADMDEARAICPACLAGAGNYIAARLQVQGSAA